MDRAKLIEEIHAEITKLQHAASLLQGTGAKREAIPSKTNPRQRTYVMNPAARKKIGDAQRARWEKIRKERAEQERAAAAKFKAASSSPSKKKK